MGSSSSTLASKCSRFLPPLPLWPLLPPMAPQPTVPPQHTTLPLPTSQLRSCPLSHTPTNTVSLMTTLRLTSRRPRPRMLKARLLDLSPSLFPMAVSRPPPTPLITTTDSSPRSPMREPQSTPQSPQVDTDTPPLPTSPLLKFQYILMKKPNLLLQILPRLMSEAVSFSHGNLLLVFKKFPNYFSLLILFNLLSFSFIYLFIYGNKTD